MRPLAKILSLLALVLLLGAPVLYLAGTLEKPAMNTLMLVATVLWFGTVGLWMGRARQQPPEG